MNRDPIRGKTLRFRFSDGVMANKTFEHSFAVDGSVTFRMLDGKSGAQSSAGSAQPEAKERIHYKLAPVGENACAVSYVSKGYTLTTILDFETMRLVAFSSNDKGVSVQHGTFDVADDRGAEPRAPAAEHRAH